MELSLISIGLFLIMFSIFFYVDVFQYQSTNFEYIFYSGATILTFIVPNDKSLLGYPIILQL